MNVTYNLTLIIHLSLDAINSHGQSERFPWYGVTVSIHVGQLEVTIKAFWSTFVIFMLKILVWLSTKSSCVYMLAESLMVICIWSVVFRNLPESKLCIFKKVILYFLFFPNMLDNSP